MRARNGRQCWFCVGALVGVLPLLGIAGGWAALMQYQKRVDERAAHAAALLGVYENATRTRAGVVVELQKVASDRAALAVDALASDEDRTRVDARERAALDRIAAIDGAIALAKDGAPTPPDERLLSLGIASTIGGIALFMLAGLGGWFAAFRADQRAEKTPA